MAANKSDQDQRELHGPGIEPEGHEVRDVNAWAVGKFAIALVFLCIFSLAVLMGFFHFLQTRNGGVATGVRPVPPQPRLETTPVPDLKAVRDAEDKILASYGWVDQSKGVVRIPIAKAIDLLAQRGLPARPQNGVQSASDATVPTEAGLGEKVQQVGGPLAGGPK